MKYKHLSMNDFDVLCRVPKKTNNYNYFDSKIKDIEACLMQH